MSAFQNSTFTRAFSSPESRESPTFHLSFISIFRDYYIRCISPSSHNQRQGTLHSWPLPPAPASSPPSAPTVWEILHRLLHRPHRWGCRFKPLPAATRPLSGRYHYLRRHRTVSADQLGSMSPTPPATAAVGLLLQLATNRPRCHHHRRLLRAFSTAYFSNHTVIFAA